MKYEQEAIDLRRASEISFREEFVNKLRHRLKQLNKSWEHIALTGKNIWYR